MPYTIRDFRELGGGKAELADLIKNYPDQWAEVQNVLAEMRPASVQKTLKKYLSAFELHRQRIVKSGENPKVIETSLPHLIKARLLTLALEKADTAIRSGAKAGGKVKLGLITGLVLQKLFFERALVRKIFSIYIFRILWPFLPGRRKLMPLVEKKGIWCFYSKQLISALAVICGTGRCLEIAAGDGTLTRFLQKAGVNIRASDDYSWSRYIEFSDEVEKLDAKTALTKYQPQTVICSWPPPQNIFEEAVFACASVEKYIVIGSRLESLTGNRASYQSQKLFSVERAVRLEKMIAPFAKDYQVLVFSRISN